VFGHGKPLDKRANELLKERFSDAIRSLGARGIVAIKPPRSIPAGVISIRSRFSMPMGETAEVERVAKLLVATCAVLAWFSAPP